MTFDQRMQRICETLTENGYKVTLIGRKLKRSKNLDFLFETKRISCFFTRGKAFYVEYNIRLFFYLLFKKSDIICAIDLDTILPALFVSKLKGNHLGYDAHEYFQEVPEVVYRKRVKKFWERVATFAIPRTDFRYTVSQGLATEFKRLYNKEFEIIRNLPRYEIPETNESIQPFLLYQGALNAGRGLETLINAAAELPINIKIAGEGDLSSELRKRVKDLNLEDKIEFLGFLKPTDLKRLTPKAFIGFNLLENNGLSYYYSLSNKFFDYTMAGVPCLVSPFPEYIALNESDNIGIITDLTVKEIVKNTNMLLSDRRMYTTLSDSAFAAAKKLNWENETKTLMGIFQKVIPLK